jgi:hypothetical protein
MNENSNMWRAYIYEEGCVSYACVVCDDLDFDSLLVEERRGERSYSPSVVSWISRPPDSRMVDLVADA